MKSETPNTAPGVERIEALVEKIESVPDLASRELMQECLSSLLELYGEGLERILSHLNGNETVRDALVEDEVVRALLFVHGLHPVSLQDRLIEALDAVRPYMVSHGGDIELTSLEDGVATLRLGGHCESCPSSNATMELAVRRAIEEACPDLDRIEVEGMNDTPPEPRFKLPPGAPAWHAIEQKDLSGSGLQSLKVNGSQVMLCKVGEVRYAYRDFCPVCQTSFGGGSLEEAVLSCPRGHRFDVHLAGISPDQPELYLDPFPLVEAGGMLKIAVC